MHRRLVGTNEKYEALGQQDSLDPQSKSLSRQLCSRVFRSVTVGRWVQALLILFALIGAFALGSWVTPQGGVRTSKATSKVLQQDDDGSQVVTTTAAGREQGVLKGGEIEYLWKGTVQHQNYSASVRLAGSQAQGLQVSPPAPEGNAASSSGDAAAAVSRGGGSDPVKHVLVRHAGGLQLERQALPSHSQQQSAAHLRGADLHARMMEQLHLQGAAAGGGHERTVPAAGPQQFTQQLQPPPKLFSHSFKANRLASQGQMAAWRRGLTPHVQETDGIPAATREGSSAALAHDADADPDSQIGQPQAQGGVANMAEDKEPEQVVPQDSEDRGLGDSSSSSWAWQSGLEQSDAAGGEAAAAAAGKAGEREQPQPGKAGAAAGAVVKRERRRGRKVLSCGGLSADDVAIGVMVPDSAGPFPKLSTVLSAYPRSQARSSARTLVEDGRSRSGGVEMSYTWLQWFPNSIVFRKLKGPHPADFIMMLAKLRHLFPGKSWYVMTHDDTYLLAHNLMCALGEQDWRKPTVMGQTHCEGPNFRCASGGVIHDAGDPDHRGFGGWINGGAGIAVSAAAAGRGSLQKCVQWYSTKWMYDQAAPDVTFSCCMRDLGVHRRHHQAFSTRPYGQSMCSCGEFGSPYCSLPNTAPLKQHISFHHLPSAAQTSLFERELAVLSTAYSDVKGYPVAHDVFLYDWMRSER